MKFPDTDNFRGMLAPSGVEADLTHVPVISGTVPTDLNGVFYRVAPDPQFPPIAEDDIWFNGDGMITKIGVQNGAVSLKQRWVRTEKFALERDAGKALFGMYRNPLTDDVTVRGKVRSTANTNVVLHAGKLLALKEDSPPTWLGPETLHTIQSVFRFNGKMTGETFTAHPKFDPDTGEMLAFGYAAKGLLTRDMVYYQVNAQGMLTREVWFELPYYCMMHDFAVTRRYALFHVVPIVSDWDRLKKRLPHFGFDTRRPVYLGVLPREGTAKDLRWFTAPNCFASHVLNAYESGSKIHFDTPTASGNLFPFFPDVDGAPFDPVAAQSRLTRWTVDMESKDETIHMERLSELVGEFPRIDERFAGRENRFGFLLVQDPTKPVDLPGGRSAAGFLMNTIARIDLETREHDSFWAGPRSSLQEPVFARRPGSHREGDGYLILVENRLADLQSRLLILDAQNLSQGPLATCDVPFRLRPGLHGNWYEGRGSAC